MSATINEAFRANDLLRSRVIRACRTAELSALFEDIAVYVLDSSSELRTDQYRKRDPELDEHTDSRHKRVKLEYGGSAQVLPSGDKMKPQPSVTWAGDGQTTFTATEVSFVVPVRKKLRLELVGTSEDGANGGIRGVNSSTGEFEVGLSWSDISQIIMLPVPEKVTPSFNFIIVPHIPASSSFSKQPLETLVFSVSTKPPKDTTYREPLENDNYALYIERALNSALSGNGLQVTVPTSDEFESKTPQGRRKGERLWHVRAHRGSKDGYLYFLETGLLFGFKKPVLFFPFDAITSISYSSIVQRTFSMNIGVRAAEPETGTNGEVVNAEDASEEIELGMIDQVDFEGIDLYVKKHGLNDASLAASRKAKKYNVNAARGDVGENGGLSERGDEDPNETELDRARRLEAELQDKEDEEEEDFVDSGGESDGSGSDSGEEEEDGEGEGEGEEEDAGEVSEGEMDWQEAEDD